MPLSHRWVDRNLSKLELVMSLLVIMLLVGSFSHYMFKVFAEAERNMINRTVININSVLNYRASMAIMRKDENALYSVINSNPMEDMRSKVELDQFDNKIELYSATIAKDVIQTPRNYNGSFIDPNNTIFEEGNWYYNLDKKMLVYIVKNKGFFKTFIKGVPRARFRINLAYIDKNGNNIFDIRSDEYIKLSLEPVESYFWELQN